MIKTICTTETSRDPTPHHDSEIISRSFMLKKKFLVGFITIPNVEHMKPTSSEFIASMELMQMVPVTFSTF